MICTTAAAAAAAANSNSSRRMQTNKEERKVLKDRRSEEGCVSWVVVVDHHDFSRFWVFSPFSVLYIITNPLWIYKVVLFFVVNSSIFFLSSCKTHSTFTSSPPSLNPSLLLILPHESRRLFIKRMPLPLPLLPLSLQFLHYLIKRSHALPTCVQLKISHMPNGRAFGHGADRHDFLYSFAVHPELFNLGGGRVRMWAKRDEK